MEMHSWHRHHECDPSEHFAIFLCTERERQRNSETMMQKSSQTNPIKKHTQNLSFDKFDRIRINFVHMKSISVEASREKKNDTGHKLEVKWLLLSFFYWKSEEIL